MRGGEKNDRGAIGSDDFETVEYGKLISSPNRKKLEILTPYGDFQACHPKVLYFKDGWHNYTYWMAYTPYPNHNSAYENPCIAVSNDMLNWTTPKGMDEVLLEDLSDVEDENIYNSDTHLVYNEDLDQIEVYWRYVDDNKNEMILNRKICKNGRSWSEKEECLHSYNRKEQDYVSPAIIYEDGLYKMWYVAKMKIFYMVSKDAKNWGRPIEIPVEYGDNYVTWHIDVIHSDIGYEIISVAYDRSTNDRSKMSLYYFYSEDNLSYTEPKIILEPRKDDSWDGRGLYRSSILRIEENYYVFYTGMANDGSVGVGLASGSSIGALR